MPAAKKFLLLGGTVATKGAPLDLIAPSGTHAFADWQRHTIDEIDFTLGIVSMPNRNGFFRHFDDTRRVQHRLMQPGVVDGQIKLGSSIHLPFQTFQALMWPSVGPLRQGSKRAALTAASS